MLNIQVNAVVTAVYHSGTASAGAVMQCLPRNRSTLRSECKKEQLKFKLLTKALMQLLSHASAASAGAVLQCLRRHRTSLSSECKKEELKLNILQSQDVRLQPTLHKQCSEEIAVFCPNVEPGM